MLTQEAVAQPPAANATTFDTITVPVSKAKEMSGLGLTTLYDRMRTGELRSTVVGSRRLVFVESLRALLERRAR